MSSMYSSDTKMEEEISQVESTTNTTVMRNNNSRRRKQWMNEKEDVTSHSTLQLLQKYYQFDKCQKFITDGNFYRVALQFPDELLGDAVMVVDQLSSYLLTSSPSDATTDVTSQEKEEEKKNVSGVKLFILADNTFGSCCPDEITAQHYQADAIIHFGYACMSRSVRLPILYVHSEWNGWDVQDCGQQILNYYNEVASVISSSASSSSNVVKVQLIIVQGTECQHLSEKLEKVVHELVENKISWKGEDASMKPNVFRFTPAVVGEKDKSLKNHQILFSSFGTKKVATAANSDDDVQDVVEAEDINFPHWLVNGSRFPKVKCFLPTAEESSENEEKSSATCGATTTTKAKTETVNTSSVVVSFQIVFFVGQANSPPLHHLSLISTYNEMVMPSAVEKIVSTLGGIDFLRVFIPKKKGGGEGEEQEGFRNSLVKSQSDVKQRIRQRMYNIERIKSAEVVGIFVASLSIAGYRETAEVLRTVLIKNGKRSYIVYVGHLNPYKVANFVDSVDCFVVVACANSQMAHFSSKSKDGFLTPLVSPAEVMIALGYAEFTDSVGFTTNFQDILKEKIVSSSSGLKKKKNAEGKNVDDESEGDEKTTKAREEEPTGILTATRPLNVAIVGTNTSLQRLHQRNYVGLDNSQIGQTPVQNSVIEGNCGIAKGYSHEGSEK